MYITTPTYSLERCSWLALCAPLVGNSHIPNVSHAKLTGPCNAITLHYFTPIKQSDKFHVIYSDGTSHKLHFGKTI